jgi:hypothetical protein
LETLQGATVGNGAQLGENNMKTYQVQIARNETTVYTIEVQAPDEDQATEFAQSRFDEGDYDHEKVVYGEEEVHSVEEIEQ